MWIIKRQFDSAPGCHIMKGVVMKNDSSLTEEEAQRIKEAQKIIEIGTKLLEEEHV